MLLQEQDRVVTLSLDPELAAALGAAAAAGGGAPPAPPEVGDWRARRETFDALLTTTQGMVDEHPEVTRTPFTATAPDGTAIPLRWYSPAGAERRATGGAGSGPAAVHAHGGGMIAGSVDGVDRDVAAYVAASGVPILSVDYRLAPEARGTVPAEDVHAGLAWLVEHADQLGVDPRRVALLGESAGGGLAAAAAILARDRGPAVARQLLVYPMLDDRTLTPDPLLVPTALWSYEDNRTGWGALLGDDLGTDAVSPVAAPARLADLTGLPPAYLEVGGLDIFRDEVVAHAQRLWAAGVPVELHVHPGAVHGYDLVAPGAGVTRRALADRERVLRSL